MAEDAWGLRTRILHHGAEIDPHTGAASVPVYQVSTYAQADPVTSSRAKRMKPCFTRSGGRA